MFEFFFSQRDQWILFRGLICVFLLATPINIFVSIMGGASPGGKGFLQALATVVGMELACVLVFLFSGRAVDSLLVLGLARSTFSYFGIIVSALIFTVGFNVFVDNLFQFNQGNYAISFYGFVGLLLFWSGIIFLGNLTFTFYKG